MRLRIFVGLVALTVMGVSLTGCEKKGGQAAVIEKEHIAAKEITSASPAPETSSSSSPTPGQDEAVVYAEATPREMAEDEIDVDGIVMKKDVRGTSRDPRAMTEEQWIVRVQMVSDLKRIKVQTDKAHWEKIKLGDRIKVSYREGKYTGTVWAADIE